MLGSCTARFCSKRAQIRRLEIGSKPAQNWLKKGSNSVRPKSNLDSGRSAQSKDCSQKSFLSSGSACSKEEAGCSALCAALRTEEGEPLCAALRAALRTAEEEAGLIDFFTHLCAQLKKNRLGVKCPCARLKKNLLEVNAALCVAEEDGFQGSLFARLYARWRLATLFLPLIWPLFF